MAGIRALACAAPVVLTTWAVPVAAQSQIFQQMLGQVLEQAREQQQQQQGSSPRLVRQLPRSTVADMQRQLNALGFNAGAPDGIMGSGTRRAVRAWQAAYGYPATGEVTEDQLQVLLSGQAGPGLEDDQGFASVGPGGGMTELPNTDLPYNDYRSGMEDPSLKRIDLGACRRACEADGQCRAFTYNHSAEVCFLKHTAAAPVPFRGATSGIKGGDGSGFTSVPGGADILSGSRPLRPAEIVELQQALNDAGYDAGTPDGRIGRRTREAVAGFAADNPGVGPDINMALLLAVSGQRPGTGLPTTFETDAYLMPRAAARTFTLLAIARDPALLASDDTVLDLLRQDARSRLGTAAETFRDWEAANTIQQPVVLSQYREALIAEAAALTDDPASFVVRLVLEGNTTLGNYTPGVGLRFAAASDPIFSSRKLDLRDNVLRINFVGVVPGLPDIYSVPVDSEEEASRFLDRVIARSNGQDVAARVYLSVTGFGADANVAGASSADPGDVPVTVAVDKLALYTRRGADREAAPGGEEVAVLVRPQSTRTAAPVSDPVLVARALGMPVLEEHVVLPADLFTSYDFDQLSATSFERASWTYFNLAAVALDPELATDGIGNDAVVSLMTSTQRLRVFGDVNHSDYHLANEFERRRAIDVLNDQVIPELVARAPVFPVPVVVLKRVRVGDYDFDRGAFPLIYDSERSAYTLPANLAGLRPAQLFDALPAALPMDSSAAERMVAGVRDRDDLRFYVAVFGTLETDGTTSIRLTPTRAGLYGDVWLTTKLMDLEAASVVPPPREAVEIAAPVGVNPEWVRRYDLRFLGGRVLFVPSRYPGFDGLKALATLFALRSQSRYFEEEGSTMKVGYLLGFDLAPYLGQDALAEYGRGREPDADGWTGADEFEREDTRQRFIADHRAEVAALLPAFPLEITVLRAASLNEYDRSRRGFSVQTSGSDLTPSGIVRSVRMVADDTAPWLEMSEADARAFLQRLRALSGQVPDPGAFPLDRVTIERGQLVVLSTYRLTGVDGEGRDLMLQATPLTRGLFALADLSTPLADLPVPRPESPGEAPMEVAVSDRPADLPQSPFDMLGVTLGMPLDEAREVLQTRLRGQNFSAVHVRPPDAASECAVIQRRLDAELAVEGADPEAIRANYIDDFNAENCPIPELQILDLAFGFDVVDDSGDVDRILVFRAGQSGDIVGAVSRRGPYDMQEAITNGMIDKYGATFVASPGDNDRVWPEHPALGPNFGRDGACEVHWSDIDRLPQAYLTNDCGAFVRQDGRKAVLVDTRYNAHQYGLIIGRIEAAAAAQPRPTLAF